MEAFAPLPVDLFSTDTGALNEEDTSAYFSLSQFDLELQAQAQAALLQQDSWQDFDRYLPIDNQLFSNSINEQAQPIFMNTTSYNDPSLLYEPLSNLIPQQQKTNLFDNYTTITSIKNEYASPESLPYSPPSLSPSQLGQQTALFQSSSSVTASPQTETKPLPTNTPLDFMNWNTAGSSFDSQGKKIK